jgi:hypothetical protein
VIEVKCRLRKAGGFQKGGDEKLGMLFAFSSGKAEKEVGVFQHGTKREAWAG